MTPAEQIAYLHNLEPVVADKLGDALLVVCDLAESALLTDEEAEAAANTAAWLARQYPESSNIERVVAVLRRLLPEQVEHRLVTMNQYFNGSWNAKCSCGREFVDTDPDIAFRDMAAHAGIGGDGVTPQEQIAYLRRVTVPRGLDKAAIAAVCDLAERALLTDDEAEVVRRELTLRPGGLGDLLSAVLRRLLYDERVEHRTTAEIDAEWDWLFAPDNHRGGPMTDVQRVWPSVPLVAKRAHPDLGELRWPWSVKLIPNGNLQPLTDAEFAAHFVAADRLDRLLAAVGRYLAEGEVDSGDIGADMDRYDAAYEDMDAAWRAYNEGTG